MAALSDPARGIILAAPASGSGKSVITMGLLRHLARQPVAVAAAKVGPDYIDPAFHGAAIAGTGWNLDPWAMRPATLSRIIERLERPGTTILCEGVMGLFDGTGPAGSEGSTAALAETTGWPVVLIVDARGMTGSVAALVRGFATHRPVMGDGQGGVALTGVILNRVGSPRHAALIEGALSHELPDIAPLGAVPRDIRLGLAERHLGLVQAGEQSELEAFLDTAADIIAEAIDIPALLALARPRRPSPEIGGEGAASVPPPGQRIAIARDIAFAFAYPHLLDCWRGAGATLSFFSPLQDEAPEAGVDAIFLPGGYPELHGAALAGAERFRRAMRDAAGRGVTIYGECGGYMVLGRSLTDLDGRTWPMLGLLQVETGFSPRRLTLGYREVSIAGEHPAWLRGYRFRAHEFHYATTVQSGGDPPLFVGAASAEGADGLSRFGHVCGSVCGSFIHLIDRKD